MATNKKKGLKITLLLFLIITVTGGFVGYKMWTKPHRNVESAKAVTVTATQIAIAYESNEATANNLYLDKVLEVSGEVASIATNQKGEPVITLKGSDMSGVICTLAGTAPATLNAGAPLLVKGICTGFLTDVVLVRCIVKVK